MIYDWGVCYKEIKTPENFRGEMFIPIIKDNVIYISKCEVVQTFKDIGMPSNFICDNDDLSFNINLKIEKKALGIFKYKSNLFIKDIPDYYLSKSVSESLEKTLFTFKNSVIFKKYLIDKKLKDLIYKNNLGYKTFKITTNTFSNKLIFNKKEKDDNYSTRVCI